MKWARTIECPPAGRSARCSSLPAYFTCALCQYRLYVSYMLLCGAYVLHVTLSACVLPASNEKQNNDMNLVSFVFFSPFRIFPIRIRNSKITDIFSHAVIIFVFRLKLTITTSEIRIWNFWFCCFKNSYWNNSSNIAIQCFGWMLECSSFPVQTHA